MSREKELVKNTAILAIGRVLPQLASLVTLPILTAFLSKIEYGTYDLVNTLVMLVLPIATLQIQSAAFRFLIECRNSPLEISKIVSNIFFVTIPLSLITCIIIPFFFSDYSILTRLLIGVYLFVDTIQITTGQIIRGIGLNKDFSISACIVSFINMLGVILGVWILKGGLNGVLFSLIISQLVGVIYYIKKGNLISYLNLKLFSSKKIKDMLSYSWPMIPNNLSNWILSLSDRLVITFALGIEATAIYGVANKIPNLLSFGQSILVMAWQENASIAKDDKNVSEYYSKMLRKVFDLMFGLTVLLISMTPIIFGLLIKGDYHEAYFQMPILILAMFFYVMSSFFGGIYIAHKKTLSVGITTIIAAIINVVIDISFVSIIGIWAGSISTLIAYAFLYFYRMINCQSFQKVSVNPIRQLILLVIIIIMLVLCFNKFYIFDIINIVLGIVLNIFINYKTIKQVCNKIKRKIK